MKYLTRLIQSFFIAIPVVVFAWLCNQNFVPSGEFVVRHSVHDSSPFIDGLLTNERVRPPVKDAQGNWVQELIADPVFFFVHPHIAFRSIDATVTFKNTNTPIVELGALAAKDPERYAFQPLQNLLIDQSTWPRIVEGDKILLQRTPTYKTISDFLAHPPALNEISTYHTNIQTPFRLSNYAPSSASQSIQASLRGAFQFKTYIKNETLNFTFAYTDLNRNEGSDPVVVSVFDDHNRSLASVRADDDKNTSTNARLSNMQTLNVSVPSLPEGVYKIDVRVDRDIAVRTITTTQQKMIFLNTVYLSDEDGYHATFAPVKLFTEAKRLSAQTRHAAGIQSVKIGSQTLAVTTPFQLVTHLVSDSGLVPVTVQKGDLELIMDAPVAFSSSHYFRPDPVRLFPHTDLDRLGVNYIIAEYTPPEEKDGWNVATIHLNAADILLDKGSWKFSFSTPEIAELKSSMFVKEIDLKFKK